MSPTHPSRRSRRRLPTICVDEHIPPVIVNVFRDHFRVIEARKDSRFKGRDEREFVMDLYAENAIFVTSDRVFAEEFARQRRQHGGAVLLPTSYSMDDRVLLSRIVVGLILGRCSRSAFGMRNQVAMPRDDGLHVTLGGRDFLEYSWTHLGHLINDSPPHLNRRVRRKGRSGALAISPHGGTGLKLCGYCLKRLEDIFLSMRLNSNLVAMFSHIPSDETILGRYSGAKSGNRLEVLHSYLGAAEVWQTSEYQIPR